RPFLVPLAWAAILVFATWRISERVRHALGGRAALAAALMTALVVLLIVIPAVLLSLALAAEIGRTFADFRLSALTVPASVLAMVGYWTAGLRTPVLLGAVTVLLALTPVGAALVYVSASAWLLVEGRVLAGVLLLAWGVLAVSLADNLIRSWFLRGATRVPFLLGFFGVIGGVATFGAVGLFLGPIAIALLLALWREW